MKHGTKSDRNKGIVIRVLNGENMSDLAKEHDVSATTVRTILHQAVYRILDGRRRNLRFSVIEKTPLKSFRAAKRFIINRL